MMKTHSGSSLWLSLSLVLLSPLVLVADEFRVGAARVDITPQNSLRLSGYASRDDSSTGVRDSLNVRAVVITPEEEFVSAHPQQTEASTADSASPSRRSRTVVLVAVDSILVTSRMTSEIASWLNSNYQLPRSQLVISSSHSHAAPHIAGGLENLYRQPSTDEQMRATQSYTQSVLAAIKQSITESFELRRPATLHMSEDKATFAVNRRVLRDGTWTGFGVQPDGLVDHRLRGLRAEAEDGSLIALAFMYACHCTTLGGEFNEVSGDWAGLSASRLEKLHPGSVVLPVIGCGANANPEPRGTYDLAGQHAAQIVDGVNRLIQKPGIQLTTAPTAHLGFAGLAPEHPTDQRLQEAVESGKPNDMRWAEFMKQTKVDMGRLPESYPMPIHTWDFGEDLTWVFLGGEVVVEYQYLIEKELPSKATWVAAYCDDVFGYVASENMRSEGGYEVDYSMIYYLQPGRWQVGTQALIVQRTREILDGVNLEREDLSASEALRQLQVPKGYRVELVAAEPLVADPINLAFGIDGRVWVVEMADYPLGNDGGGRIRVLQDTNGDGVLDQGHLFATELSYPTSVFPWRDGVVVIAAPNILMLRDTDGDMQADSTEVLFTGFKEANPQHRANGFELGLDGWLYLGVGDGTREVTSLKLGKTFQVSGHDIAIHVDSGELMVKSGETQFVRSRDAFGNWFGNSNSLPMFQFVFDSLGAAGGFDEEHHLLTPAVAPPVYPRNLEQARFNDLYALRRFTSACSSTICRTPGLGGSGEDLDYANAFICEPVHNLVARIRLDSSGPVMTAVRHPDDGEFDFLTSTDSSFRPVRIINAPDGSIWVVDMARKVIEHPEWIPVAWQSTVDLRGGSSLGRIFRVYRDDYTLQLNPIGKMYQDWLHELTSANGTRRDLAAQAIITASTDELPAGFRAKVEALCSLATEPAARASALGVCAGKGWLTPDILKVSMRDPDWRVQRYALSLMETPSASESLIADLCSLGDLHPAVELEWIQTVAKLDVWEAHEPLQELAARSLRSRWHLEALAQVKSERLCMAVAHALLSSLDSSGDLSPDEVAQVQRCLSRLASSQQPTLVTKLLATFPITVGERDRLPLSASVLLAVVTSDGREVAPEVLDQLAEFRKLIANRAEYLTQKLTSSRSDQQTFEAGRWLLPFIGTSLMERSQARAIINSVLSADIDDPIKEESVRFAARDQRLAIDAYLIDNWPNLSGPLRGRLSSVFLTSTSRTRSLVEAIEQSRVAASDLSIGTIADLRSYRDRSLRARCLAVFDKPTPREELVTQYMVDMAQLKQAADKQAGKKLFEQQCSACHATHGNAKPIGPPLNNLKHWTAEQWTTAVLAPNKNVEPKYFQSNILTSDGRTFAGLVVEQDANELRIATSDGTLRTIATDEIDQQQESSLSLMPEGFESKLTPTQLADLLAYLKSL